MIYNFLFHRVNPTRNKLWDPMDVALFDKCISYISKKYKVVLFEDYYCSKEYKTAMNVATIMFDDGYKDNIQYAAPVLEKYNCKASFYVVTDCIDRNIPTWTHLLEHLFENTVTNSIELDFDFLPQKLKVNSLNSTDARVEYVSKLKPFLKKISHENRRLVLDKVRAAYSDVNIPDIMMSWDDIRLLNKAGHYIGSHTVNHSMLGTISSKEDILFELTQSGKRIKEELGYFPLSISYPVGSFNEITKELSLQAGYSIGLAVEQKKHDPQRDDIFEVPRIELYNESWLKTKLRITNTLEIIKSLIRYK